MTVGVISKLCQEYFRLQNTDGIKISTVNSLTRDSWKEKRIGRWIFLLLLGLQVDPHQTG